MCISDLDPHTVELLLQYCYGRLSEMPNDHSEVLFNTHWLLYRSCCSFCGAFGSNAVHAI